MLVGGSSQNLRTMRIRMPELTRKLTITAERKLGIVHFISIVVNGHTQILSDGSKHTKTLDIEDADVPIRISAGGESGASFEVSFDLPGTAKDFKQEFPIRAHGVEIEFKL